ncbi:MAG TPA: choline/ethanolamine kinase family protein [Anaerolineales bacterium]|nr:choline/ethanolamine kinase family protein [Anaerolineales bacterium]
MPVTIDQVIQLIPDWRGRSVTSQPLSGGLTNTNYKVEVDGAPYFVRIPGESTDLLAVDRKNEHHNTVAAAKAGVGPKVIYHLPEHNVMVMEFIQGKTMSIQALQAPGMASRIAQSVQRLHAGPRFLTDFNMFRLVEFYLRRVKEHDVRIPQGYRERLPTVRRIEQAVTAHALPTVPCNNDLLAENYIDDGETLRLIDFEYSGNNDPCFELGNTCQELQYDDERFSELCGAYFGAPRSHVLARMRLYALMSDIGWTLWGALQSKVSTLDYDFWGYAQGRWARAVRMLDSAEFPIWLEEARRDD